MESKSSEVDVEKHPEVQYYKYVEIPNPQALHVDSLANVTCLALVPVDKDGNPLQ